MISIYVGGQLRTKAFTLASDAITSPELVVLDEYCLKSDQDTFKNVKT